LTEVDVFSITASRHDARGREVAVRTNIEQRGGALVGALLRFDAMADPARRRATHEDLVRVPSNLVAEIVDGVLLTQPRPASLHAVAASVLGGELSGPFHRGRGGPGGWVILDEPELHLDEDVLVPDLAGWRRERMPEVPDAPAFELPPDWVCEVLSPSTETLDRAQKVPLYAGAGVSHVWLLNPRARTLEVLALDGAVYRIVNVFAENAAVRTVPFDAIEIELGALWAR
jgi:Uma2 family endonuclease